jgi:hypothetical protein
MNKIFKKIYISLLFSLVLFFLFPSFSSIAALSSAVGTDPVEFLEKVAEWIADVVIYASVVMGLVAAFWFIISGGKPDSVTKGREALKWTVIGLAVVILANPILDIIRAQLGTGSDVKTILNTVVGYLQTIGGPVAIVSFLWGSALYTTGIEKNIKKAHIIFLWTSIGVAVILVASSIEAFVRYFIS